MYRILCTLSAAMVLTGGSVTHAEADDVSYAELLAFASRNYSSAGPGHRPHSVLESLNAYAYETPYEIEQESSTLEVSVDSPIGEIRVSFDDFDGNFTLLTEREVRRDRAIIDVNAKSLETDSGLVGMMLKSKGFLDIKHFPAMNFVGRSLEWYGHKHAVLTGELTIKDRTRQVAFYLELIDADIDKRGLERITLKAAASIKRSEFGIDTLLPVVGDQVNFHIRVNAIKNTVLSVI